MHTANVPTCGGQIFFHPKYEPVIETEAFGWKDHSRDGEGSERYGVYAGAFGEEGTINVERMDLLTCASHASCRPAGAGARLRKPLPLEGRR